MSGEKPLCVLLCLTLFNQDRKRFGGSAVQRNKKAHATKLLLLRGHKYRTIFN